MLLSILLAVAVVFIVGLTIALLGVKGKLPCMKGDK